MIRIYSRLQQEFPSDYDVNLFMGKFFLRLEMIDEGLEQLLKAETLEPGARIGEHPARGSVPEKGPV